MPQPVFLLQLNDSHAPGGRLRGQKHFKFAFTNAMIDQPPRIEDEKVILRSRVLKKPIDSYLTKTVKKATYAYRRLTNSEVLMSKDVFVSLGLSQPAWVTIEAETKYMHLAMAFMMPHDYEDESFPLGEDKRDAIVLSPMLDACYTP